MECLNRNKQENPQFKKFLEVSCDIMSAGGGTGYRLCKGAMFIITCALYHVTCCLVSCDRMHTYINFSDDALFSGHTHTLHPQDVHLTVTKTNKTIPKMNGECVSASPCSVQSSVWIDNYVWF